MTLHPRIELVIRFVYFRLKFEKILAPFKKRRIKNKITLTQIKETLVDYGIKKGDDIMIHSSFSRIDCSPQELINFLKDFIGQNGNILVPTHPVLTEKKDELIYDVVESPSTVGVFTEKFRNSPGVRRSRHPFSSVAVWGKDAEWYLEGNLDGPAPLPHGKNSPYYKFAQKGGIAVCLGINAIGRATIRHVAEEYYDDAFPVKNFYLNYRVKIIDNSFIITSQVRKANLRLTQLYIAKSRIRKAWLEKNILKEYSLNNTPIHFVDCNKCLNYMLDELNEGRTCYPYAPKQK